MESTFESKKLDLGEKEKMETLKVKLRKDVPIFYHHSNETNLQEIHDVMIVASKMIGNWLDESKKVNYAEH